MKILFPNHPLKSRLPDPDYENEFNSARDAGFECEVYGLEDLRGGDLARATRLCSEASTKGEEIFHRGWMMNEALYSQLFAALVTKGYQPVTSPDQYAKAHYLPNAYPIIRERTAETVWTEGKDVSGAWEKYKQLGRPAAIVKDFVKSAKHRWNEACYIPAGAERDRFDEILKAFLEARGDDFEKGIVLRRFHEFRTLGDDNRGQPIHEEYRLFLWRGSLLVSTATNDGTGPLEKLTEWEAIARQFQNPFISMDIARQLDGSWIIVEVGDGGVSGLPPSIEPALLYKKLRERVT